MKIYDEYTSKVLSASHCQDLSKFAQKLCAKMGVIGIGGKAEDRANVLAIIRENDPEVLQILREETQLVVLMMREKIEQRKSQHGEDAFSMIDAHIENLVQGGGENGPAV